MPVKLFNLNISETEFFMWKASSLWKESMTVRRIVIMKDSLRTSYTLLQTLFSKEYSTFLFFRIVFFISEKKSKIYFNSICLNPNVFPIQQYKILLSECRTHLAVYVYVFVFRFVFNYSITSKCFITTFSFEL